MSYIDAGYASALVVLFAYAVTLRYRHRRFSQLAEAVSRAADLRGVAAGGRDPDAGDVSGVDAVPEIDSNEMRLHRPSPAESDPSRPGRHGDRR